MPNSFPHTFSEKRRAFFKMLLSRCSGSFVFALGFSSFASFLVGNSRHLAHAGATPLPPGATEVPPTDPVGNAIGYTPDKAKIDKTRYASNMKAKDFAKQHCVTCSLYTPVNAGWGKCQMITTGGLVSAQGWCGSWSKKS